MNKTHIVFLNIFLALSIGLVLIVKANNCPVLYDSWEDMGRVPEQKPIEQPEKKPNISMIVPQEQMTYDAIQKQLDIWHTEAPSITEVGVCVGKTANKAGMKYLRIGKKSGPKVLIMAAIHGNEKLGSMVSMGCIGNLLQNYMESQLITDLLRTREIYYIPVANPEGYINNIREEEGEDPNRSWLDKDFNDRKSVTTVEAIKELHRTVHFNAVLSCHDYGKTYMIPWGYKNAPTDCDAEYQRIVNEMSKYTKYRFQRLYGNSVGNKKYGYEEDWFYKFGSFSLVAEIGDHFEATPSEIKNEVLGNYLAMLVFIKEAPLVRGGACASFLMLDQWNNDL